MHVQESEDIEIRPLPLLFHMFYRIHDFVNKFKCDSRNDALGFGKRPL
jgi:hypothetical protein